MHQTKNAQPRVRLSARKTDLLAGVISSESTLDPITLQSARLCRRFGLPASTAAVVTELADQNAGRVHG